MFYKKITIDGYQIELASENIQQNELYHIRVDGREYKFYAESVIDRERKPSERFGQILHVSRMTPMPDEAQYQYVVEVIRKVMPLSYDKSKDPFIFFQYR